LRGVTAARWRALRDEAALRACGVSRRRSRRILVEHVIERARAQGYREMYLDTMPKMRAARVMYDILGFKVCAPYLTEPTPARIAWCWSWVTPDA
jgi:GNAT superfamily N-acetyltransferase